MQTKRNQDQEPFFWIKGGQRATPDSIQTPMRAPEAIGAPKSTAKSHQSIGDTKHAGLKTGWTRASFIVREEYLLKIKGQAYRERRGIKDILDEALQRYLESRKDGLTEIGPISPGAQ